MLRPPAAWFFNKQREIKALAAPGSADEMVRVRLLVKLAKAGIQNVNLPPLARNCDFHLFSRRLYMNRSFNQVECSVSSLLRAIIREDRETQQKFTDPSQSLSHKREFARRWS